jgi:hypothetical protein
MLTRKATQHSRGITISLLLVSKAMAAMLTALELFYSTGDGSLPLEDSCFPWVYVVRTVPSAGFPLSSTANISSGCHAGICTYPAQ